MQPANPNSTFTKENKQISKVANTTVSSYDITPARHELSPEQLKDEDNYDIAGLRSDEDTDDEDASAGKTSQLSTLRKQSKLPA